MVYVCIPVHEEARSIGVLLWKIRKVMAEFGRDYRILVLDDASGDDTPEVLARYEDVLPLEVIRSETRLGYPRAVERLLERAVELAPYPKRDGAVVLQGDFTEDPSHIVELVKTLEGGADIVAGSVGGSGERLPRSVRWTRRLAPWLLGRTHGDAPVSDPLCGFRVYRIIVLKKALRDRETPLTTRDGWASNVELLGELAPHARRIEETPLEMRYELLSRESRFHPWRAMRDLFAARRRVAWDAEAGGAG